MSPNYWHAGELAVQDRTGVLEAVHEAQYGRMLRKFDRATPQLENFFQELQCVALASLDEHGAVWSSFVTGSPGFISFAPSASGHGRPMFINTPLNPADPLRRNLQQGIRISWPTTEDKTTRTDAVIPIGFVGVMFHNRRRNRLNGNVKASELAMGNIEGRLDLTVEVDVVQQFGNCPKYIHMRHLHPISLPPSTILRSTIPDEPLPESAKELIRASDTLFIASRHIDADLGSAKAGLDCNHRGGPKGWARLEKDGLSLVMPDYSGNRFFQTLGNITTENQAGVTLLHNQSLLYLTGTATTYYDASARAIMPRSDRLTVLKITSWILAGNVVPFEWTDVDEGASPYNPRLKYLAWEEDTAKGERGAEVILREVQIVSKNVATFSFELERPTTFHPGYHAVMDLGAQLPHREYEHMNQFDPSALNEDGVRSWTVSNWVEAPNNESETNKDSTEISIVSFDLTIKDMRSATRRSISLSGLLHEWAKKLIASETRLSLMGFGGRFGLREFLATSAESESKVFFVAGGIGITPFLALLTGLQRHLSQLFTTRIHEIVLVVFTQHDDFAPILASLLQSISSPDIDLTIHSFATRLASTLEEGKKKGYELRCGSVEIDAGLMQELGYEKGMACLGCGPERLMSALGTATEGRAVHVEEFSY